MAHNQRVAAASAILFLAIPCRAQSLEQRATFDVVGTTIAETQQAIREGRTTCREVVETYLRRIAEYDQKPIDGLRLPSGTGCVAPGASRNAG